MQFDRQHILAENQVARSDAEGTAEVGVGHGRESHRRIVDGACGHVKAINLHSIEVKNCAVIQNRPETPELRRRIIRNGKRRSEIVGVAARRQQRVLRHWQRAFAGKEQRRPRSPRAVVVLWRSPGGAQVRAAIIVAPLSCERNDLILRAGDWGRCEVSRSGRAPGLDAGAPVGCGPARQVRVLFRERHSRTVGSRGPIAVHPVVHRVHQAIILVAQFQPIAVIGQAA